MNNNQPWEYDVDQDEDEAIRQALKASQQASESSLYSYPNAFYFPQAPSSHGPYGPAGDSRIDLSTPLPMGPPQPRNGSLDLTNIRAQAHNSRAINPFRRRDISRADPSGRPYVPPPNLGQPYRDIYASLPTDRTPVGPPERMEDRTRDLQAAGILMAMGAGITRSDVELAGGNLLPGRNKESAEKNERQRDSLSPTSLQGRSNGTWQDEQQRTSPPTSFPQAAGSAEGTKQCGRCEKWLPLSMFAKGMGYQKSCLPCREKHNAADRAAGEKRKEDDKRDMQSGVRTCRMCGQTLALNLHFGGKEGGRGSKYYVDCAECRRRAEEKKKQGRGDKK